MPVFWTGSGTQDFYCTAGIHHSRAPSGVYLLYTIRSQGFYLPLLAQFILTISTRCNGVFADS